MVDHRIGNTNANLNINAMSLARGTRGIRRGMRFGGISLLAVAATTLATLPAGCGNDVEESAGTGSTLNNDASGSVARPAWLLTSAPAESDRTVAEVKASPAAEGERIVIRGRIGGNVKPIAEDVAVFHIVDPSLKACSDNPGDMCATPWDYCCETPESMQANTATIQVVNAAGEVEEVDIRTLGLAPLDEVIVVGTVGPRPNAAVLDVRAEGIYRVTG